MTLARRGSPFFLNALWNFLGSLLPLVAGLVAIPLLATALGVERFGLLNLAWILVGYFSLFDFGVSRAITKVVAEQIASGRLAEIPRLVCSALGLMRWLGFIAAVVLAVLSPWAVNWLNVAEAAREETLGALLVLAVALPYVLLSAGWRGILEGYGRFDLVNWVRIPLGIAIFIAPLAVLPFSQGLVPVVVALAVARIIGWWCFRILCLRLNPALRSNTGIERALLRPLLSFGGWMTVSNVVGPLMVYADRFLIAGVLSAVAVAYYATPYEIVTRLWVISGAVTGVMFPIIAGRIAVDRFGAASVYRGAMKCVFLGMLPAVAAFYLFAYEGLNWWLGEGFAKNGFRVAQILVIGVLVNALGQVAITVLHGAGRADWSAKLHMAELPFYLLVLIFVAERYGIVGVASVWLLRVAIDSGVMFIMAEQLLDQQYRLVIKHLAVVISVLALLVVAGMVESAGLKIGVLCLLLFACVMLLPRQLRMLGKAAGGAVSS